MQHKNFMDIKVASEETITGFNPGDHIVIQTKIDGANAAIRYDSKTDSIVAQSRKNILDMTNNLRGFYEFTQLLDKENIKRILGDRYVVFGEWLVRHTVVYPQERYDSFYCYDVYDTELHTYLSQDNVKEFADTLDLTYVWTWYDGKFISWEHCKSFLGYSAYGEVEQEGIVVKNMSLLSQAENRLPVYVKIVNDKFKETKHTKKRVKKPAMDADEYAEVIQQVEEIVTRARVEKIVHKAVDESLIPEIWTTEDLGTIAKCIPKEVVQDCLKEEKEIALQIKDFGKLANKVTMQIVKEMLGEKTKEI